MNRLERLPPDARVLALAAQLSLRRMHDGEQRVLRGQFAHFRLGDVNHYGVRVQAQRQFPARSTNAKRHVAEPSRNADAFGVNRL